MELERLYEEIAGIEYDRDAGLEYNYQELDFLIKQSREKEASLLRLISAAQLEECRRVRKSLKVAKGALGELRRLYKREARSIRPREIVYTELIERLERNMVRAGFGDRWGRIGSTKEEMDSFKEAMRQAVGIPLGEGIVCAVCGDRIIEHCYALSSDNYYCSKEECRKVMKQMNKLERWLRVAKSMASRKCMFNFGGCNKPAGSSGFCAEHEGVPCYCCGEQAIVEEGSQVNAAWLVRFSCEEHESFV